ncbi:unnamed protein product [Clavelina lepadiformis]|uniref:Uncharacterized protein n=1 Tax=Clavelina lepadiformis TaxID=159417 RepID=A0ABP0G3C3_CLALP
MFRVFKNLYSKIGCMGEDEDEESVIYVHVLRENNRLAVHLSVATNNSPVYSSKDSLNNYINQTINSRVLFENSKVKICSTTTTAVIMITPLPFQTTYQQLHDTTSCRVLFKNSMLHMVKSR